MNEHPNQRFARRSSIPSSKGRRPVTRNTKPNLRPVEQTLFILMSESQLWHLTDEFLGETTTTSSMEQALRRRGATVRKLSSPIDDKIIQVWARWDHQVPRDVAPWMVPHDKEPQS